MIKTGIGLWGEVIFLMMELVTPKGELFRAESVVTIGDRSYPLEELSQEQRDYILASRDVHALNAVFAGRAVFTAERLPKFQDVFSKYFGQSNEKQKDP